MNAAWIGAPYRGPAWDAAAGAEEARLLNVARTSQHVPDRDRMVRVAQEVIEWAETLCWHK